MTDLTIPGLLIAAIGALTTVVSLLWRTLERRTESVLATNAEHVRVLTQVRESLSALLGVSDVLRGEHTAQTEMLTTRLDHVVAHVESSRVETSTEHNRQGRYLVAMHRGLQRYVPVEDVSPNGDPTGGGSGGQVAPRSAGA